VFGADFRLFGGPFTFAGCGGCSFAREEVAVEAIVEPLEEAVGVGVVGQKRDEVVVAFAQGASRGERVEFFAVEGGAAFGVFSLKKELDEDQAGEEVVTVRDAKAE
jgi:hypothetical protein